MGSKRIAWLVGTSAALLLVLSCDVLAAPRGRGGGAGRGFGPPAHAPAYGYRNKVVYGYTLIFDSDFGLYIVVGLTDCYYHQGHFYRWRAGVWEISLRADRWEPVGRDKMPAALQLKAKSVAKYNSPGNAAAKPAADGNLKAAGDGKLNPGGNNDAKADSATGDAKPNARGNDPAKPGGAGRTDVKPNATGNDPAAKSPGAAGNSGKPAGVADAKPKATVGSSTKPDSTSGNPAKPSDKSSGGSKAKSAGKGKR